MARYQLPGAEPFFYCRTMAFCCVIAQLSPTQRERKQMLGKPGIRIQVHRQQRDREKIAGDGFYYRAAGSLITQVKI